VTGAHGAIGSEAARRPRSLYTIPLHVVARAVCSFIAALMLAQPAAQLAAAPNVLAGAAFGLYPAADFRLTTGRCSDCPTIPQALWYFRDESIAVANPHLPVAGFSLGMRASDDLRAWVQSRGPDAPIDYPPLVWSAAPEMVRNARLSADGRTVSTPAATAPFALVPKIALNRSYFDASSAAFFADRPAQMRGSTTAGRFTARTLWPEDFTLGPAAPPPLALPAGLPAPDALRALMRGEPRGGARSPFVAGTLWQRAGLPADWTGRPVLAFMVNGAQGDDDEAHAGHFALVTGRIAATGQFSDWLVNNFYSLDIVSEKGILAAPLPLDAYLGDLNSGQNWYRPTYMVVAVLRDDRAAALVQSAVNRVYNQFYRHQLVYYHPSENCTSISVDALRALGWPVPELGPTNPWLAWASLPLVALKEGSIAKAKVGFDYLVTERTRMLPAAAFETIFASLGALARGDAPKESGLLAHMLAEDLAAIAYVRIPQFPSSRATGDAPVATLAEYHARIPKDPALAQIVPVPERAFPAELRDADLLPPAAPPSQRALLAWGAALLLGVAFLFWRWFRSP